MEWPELAYAHTYAHDENRNSHGRTTDARTCGCGLFAKDAEKATTYVRYGDSDHSPRHVTKHISFSQLALATGPGHGESGRRRQI